MPQGTNQDGTGQTELLGLLLLVAVTVFLVAIIATYVFGLGDGAEPDPPESNFSIGVEEDVEPERTDSFGTRGTNYDVLLRVTHVDGDAVPAERLWIRGPTSFDQARSWADTVQGIGEPAYEPGSSIDTGDAVTVWVRRNDTVRVTWTADTGNRSETLHVWRGVDNETETETTTTATATPDDGVDAPVATTPNSERQPRPSRFAGGAARSVPEPMTGDRVTEDHKSFSAP